MKKIIAFYNDLSSKKYFYLALSSVWVLSVLLLIVWSFKHYVIGINTNDDIYMSMLNCGTYGTMDPHNVFNNLLLGYVYVFLYKLSPSHNWNTLVQLGVIFSSYILFGVWNICRNKFIKGYLTSAIVVLATWESMICRINFSKTGAIALAVGFVLFISSLDTYKYKSVQMRLVRILGALYIIGGGLFRKDTLLASLPFAGIAIVYFIFKYGKDSQQNNSKGIPQNIAKDIPQDSSKDSSKDILQNISKESSKDILQDAKKSNSKFSVNFISETLPRLIPMLVVAATLIILWVGNDIEYNSRPEWKHYLEFNKYRSELLDYEMPTYYSNVEAFEELGLSENDYWVLRHWLFADEDVFSTETLKALVDLKHSQKSDVPLSGRIADIFEQMIDLGAEFIGFYVVIFFFLILVAINDKKKSLYLLFTFLAFAGEFVMIIMKGRAIERALYVPILFAVISILFYQDTGEVLCLDTNNSGQDTQGNCNQDSRESLCQNSHNLVVQNNRTYRLSATLIPLVLFICIGVYTLFASHFLYIKEIPYSRPYDKTKINSILSYTNDHIENLYVIDGTPEGVLLIQSFGPFDSMAEVRYYNLTYMGGWQVPTPTVLNIARPYGNPYNVFEMLAENDSVYWISAGDPQYEYFPLYMQEHYSRNVEVVDRFGEYFVCRFVP